MKRSTLKWIFGIHLTLLILLIMFDVGLWALANVSAIIQADMFPDVLEYRKVTFWEFMSFPISSPMLYIHLYIIAAVIASAVALVVTRKRKG